MMKGWWKGRKKWLLALVVATAAYYFLLPARLFDVPYSTIIEDRTGQLLCAAIAADGQWRFPLENDVPEKFAKAIVLFEDKRFHYHPGVDPLSMARAVTQNVRAGKVVSGGSTLTMQVIRMARKNKARTVLEKLIEIVLATRLEWRHSKEEILAIYAAHAPFGGNVVGLEAACWRYFGRQPNDLSWSEAALLAVLPNNPSLIHLTRNRDVLLNKRNRLLQKIRDQGWIDELTLELSLAETLPESPLPMPRWAPHLLDRAVQEGKAGLRATTTLDLGLQKQMTALVNDYAIRLQANQVWNAAALVLHAETGQVLAYMGNVPVGAEHHEAVDLIRAPRSTGSILKPILYAAMQQEGQLLPRTLLPDIPTMMGGFTPKNFSLQYDGAVPAHQALIRSLNIPAVHALRQFRFEKFHALLQEVGITTLDKPADHYGLSLILGGAEATLWDVTGVYASMARTLTHYFDRPGDLRYRPSDFHEPVYTHASDKHDTTSYEASAPLRAGAVWLTFNALQEVYRPGEETGWRYFESSKKIAWKTGTSFGFRDAWAVGVNPDYVVGVWVGNADGEGRPGLTGTEMAAPLLFRLFSQLPGNAWFDVPRSELQQAEVCVQSGMLASEPCSERETQWVTKEGTGSLPCVYHKKIHLSPDGRHRVHSDCESVAQMKPASWFVLPPVQEYYYRVRHSSYKSLPPFRGDCQNPTAVAAMDLIYPKWDTRIFLPRALDGTPGSTVFQVVHRDPAATIHWHLDGKYVGTTVKTHKMPFAPGEGQHQLVLVDAAGETLERPFRVYVNR